MFYDYNYYCRYQYIIEQIEGFLCFLQSLVYIGSSVTVMILLDEFSDQLLIVIQISHLSRGYR